MEFVEVTKKRDEKYLTLYPLSAVRWISRGSDNVAIQLSNGDIEVYNKKEYYVRLQDVKEEDIYL